MLKDRIYGLAMAMPPRIIVGVTESEREGETLGDKKRKGKQGRCLDSQLQRI